MLQPELSRAQVLGLSNLGVDRSGQGTPLFNLVLRNNSLEELRDLYFSIEVRSSKVGVIARIDQRSDRPFHLSGGQVVVASNNQIQNGLPGVEESIRFNGGLTETGETFVNDLDGSTNLPADIYTVTLQLYQGNNGPGGGELLASVEQDFGENISPDTNVDLYLLQPGGEPGSGEMAPSTLPVFRWDGPTNSTYRLIVVEDNGQSPETLIQSALGSDPILDQSRSVSGSLLEFEMVDARLNELTFSMPPSSVQSLEDGTTYFWQVFTMRSGVNAAEQTPSEIWEFTTPGAESGATANVSTEVDNSLTRILGSDQLQQLVEDGYNFNSIVIDGQTYSGAAAIKKLQELSNRIQNGEITIVVE
ncbi:MAG: hypothetical protein R3281_18160 [Balneolaceae bacterium]|nr:hypothetical protein [Balneolaceae bacterium]